ncbi:MAG: hypothetical protein FWF87_08315 [Synergistaceae bacterium]|nr:hypothetical protein [Synergistaceae bacterium]
MKKIFSCASAFIIAAAFLSVFSILSVSIARAADSSEAMEAYKAVLKNEMEFKSVNHKNNYKLHEFDSGEGEPLKVERFAVVDMDGDGIPEVVLDFQMIWVGVLILHYEDGKVYGFTRPYMAALANDGTYNGNASYAPYNVQYYKVTSVKKDAYKEESLAHIEYKAEGGDIEIISYRIGSTKVSEEEFNAFVDKVNDHIAENEAVWFEFTDANVESALK